MYGISAYQTQKNFFFPLLLGTIAAVYYGQYYNCGFNIADEGVHALRSMRLLHGEVPFLDMELNNGLLWYYPLVVLFGVFGVNFVLMKVYFFFLAALTSLLGYAVVSRLTGKRGMAFICATLLILVPGTIHKAYIPLIIVGNMYFVTRIDFERTVLDIRQLAPAFGAAALSWLIRSDLGIYVTSVLLGVVLAHILTRGRASWADIMSNVRILCVMGGLFFLIIFPFVVISLTQGFFESFASYMVLWPKLREQLFPASQMSSMVDTSSLLVDLMRLHPDAGRPLSRIPFSDIWQSSGNRTAALLTYMPLFIIAITCICLTLLWLARTSTGPFRSTNQAIRLLSVLALAVGALPQFIVWRPDMGHLSQFMPGMLVLEMVLIGSLLYSTGPPARESSLVCQSGWTLVPRIIVGAVLVFHVTFYTWYGLTHHGTGSIAVAKGCSRLFEAENGIRVYVDPQTWTELTNMKRLVETFAGPRDYVVCFPYSPGINVMTNRMTFMRHMGVSDAWLFRPGWQEETVHQIASKKPAIILISDWAINNREISKFSNWATIVTRFVSENYRDAGVVLGHRIYIAKE